MNERVKYEILISNINEKLECGDHV